MEEPFAFFKGRESLLQKKSMELKKTVLKQRDVEYINMHDDKKMFSNPKVLRLR